MFVVKAQYRAETRKFIFKQFPTWDELYEQLYKVFRINNFFLSKLLLSAEDDSGRVLIGREAHSAQQYYDQTLPHRIRNSDHGVLRIVVCDEVARKEPHATQHGSTTSTTAMDIDGNAVIDEPQPKTTSTISGNTADSCCSVASTKQEIKSLMDNFVRDLNSAMVSTFGTEVNMALDSPARNTDPAVPAQEPEPSRPIPGSFFFGRPPSPQPVPNPADETASHPGVWCDNCEEPIVGIRHKCGDCRNYDLCSTCLAQNDITGDHPRSHHFFQITAPSSNNRATGALNATADTGAANNRAPIEIRRPQSPGIPIHNATCDVCDDTIIGTRHKCLDCPDYDQCDICHRDVESTHPDHQFIAIDEPGRIVIHTVRDDRPAPTAASEPSEPAVHPANCDLCDSRIQGERYKCLTCPDFDTCSSCYRITPEQHPRHQFIKLESSDNILQAVPAEAKTFHHATCDSCNKQIVGPRFKCMHPSCPDIDFCADCEALPIPVHPVAHPLVKLREPITEYSHLAKVFKFIHQPNTVPAETQTQAPIPAPVRTHVAGATQARVSGHLLPVHVPAAVSARVPAAPPAAVPAVPESMERHGPRVPRRSVPGGVRVIAPTAVPVSRGRYTPRIPRRSILGGVEIPAPAPPVAIPAPTNQPQYGPAPWPVPFINSFPEYNPWNPRTNQVAPEPSRNNVIPNVESYWDQFQASLRPFDTVSNHDGNNNNGSSNTASGNQGGARHSGDIYDRPNGRRAGYGLRRHDYSSQAILNALPPICLPSPPPAPPVPVIFESQSNLPDPVARSGSPVERPFVSRRNSWYPPAALRLSPRFHRRSPSPRRSDTHYEVRSATPPTPPLMPATGNMDRASSSFNFYTSPLPTESRVINPYSTSPVIRSGFNLGLRSPSPYTERAESPSTIVSDHNIATGERPTSLVATQAHTPDPIRSTEALEKEISFPSVPNEDPFASTASLIPEMSQREATPIVSLPQTSQSPFDDPPSSKSSPRVPDANALPQATFVSDNNLTDGHVFPPGAEFVKSWRMKNTGDLEWSEDTSIVYVGGYRMGSGPNAYKIGNVVAVGEEVDVQVFDLKAPEEAGTYISYWRLCDSEGRLFGDRVWCHITVPDAELSRSLSDSNPEISSSEVIMPLVPSVTAAATATNVTAPGSPALSNATSAVPVSAGGSLISFSDGEEDSASDSSGLWEDARPGARDSQDYVLVYDSSSEEA